MVLLIIQFIVSLSQSTHTLFVGKSKGVKIVQVVRAILSLVLVRETDDRHIVNSLYSMCTHHIIYNLVCIVLIACTQKILLL